jgi:phage gp29-like protein
VDTTDGATLLLRDVVREPLSPHKFVVHRHPQKSGLLLRSGLARLASWAWMYKAFTLRDWAVFVQNYGAPMRVGRYGPEASDEEKTVLWRAVANIAGDCAAIIP